MMYSDREILSALNRGTEILSGPPELNDGRWIVVEPIDDMEKAIQPATVDMRLSDEFMWFPSTHGPVDIIERKVSMESASVGGYRLEPGGFVLGSTIERVHLGDRIAAKVEGKSSLGRIGLAIHITAGFIDPGFNGRITLEFANVSSCPIILRQGAYICQVAFYECSSRAIRPYGTKGLGSRYQDQRRVTKIK